MENAYSHRCETNQTISRKCAFVKGWCYLSAGLAGDSWGIRLQGSCQLLHSIEESNQLLVVTELFLALLASLGK